jgi:phage FluMu gp28-like protein
MNAPVTTEQWQAHREAARQQMPEHVDAGSPDVLLGYQKELLSVMADNQVVVVEKSRRIGATWGIAADAVLTAGAEKSAAGQDVLYIGYNLDMTREFIDTCASWAKSFSSAASEVSEFLFREQDERGAERAIQAFRIRFLSGFEIVALCSRPRSLRGRQGYVILDEFAFHDEPGELLKAAMALLIWGGKVLIISTHDGADNPFNELIQNCRAGKRPYKVLRITFDDAIKDGLFRRVCLVTGKPWSAEAEAAWRAEIVGLYGDDADEELHCIPRLSGGKYFSRVLLESRTIEAPVLQWKCDDTFVDLSDDQRATECGEWCIENLTPLLAALAADCRGYLGEDFGRTGDLTVMWPLVLEKDLMRRTPFTVELRNVPFREQEQVLTFICDRLPRFSGAALDARGNGQYLAERARQRYGTDTIAQVMLSEGWYREHFPKLKSALEDGKFALPANSNIIDDFRTVEVVQGVPRVVERTGVEGDKRHGDSAIAAVLAQFASSTLEGGDFNFVSGDSPVTLEAFDDSYQMTGDLEGWNS